MGKMFKKFRKNIPLFLFILNVIVGTPLTLVNDAYTMVRASPSQATHNNPSQILILYGSQEDKIISLWLSQGFQLEIQYHSLTNINTLLNSTLDWNDLKAVWIINSNTSLFWEYPFGIIFNNIIKYDLNVFLITSSLKWIDPSYWGIFGIEDVAWYSKYLFKNSSPRSYKMSVYEPKIPSSLINDNDSLENLSNYLTKGFTISGYSEWVKFKPSENSQKIIDLTPLDANINMTNSSTWESGTLMRLNQKNVILVTTFIPRYDELNSSNPLSVITPKFNQTQATKINALKAAQISNNTPTNDLEAWSLLKIIGSWTFTFTFSLNANIFTQPTLTDKITNILPVLAIGSLMLLGLVFFLSKTGIIRSLVEKILTFSISMIFLIGSITYKPFKRRLSEEDLLENEIRQKIVDYLEKKGSSGAHLREIQAHVNKSISSVLWHLQTLKQFGLIDSKKVGKYKIFYLTRPRKTTDEVKPVNQLQLMEWSTLMKSKLAKNIVLLLLNSKKPIKLTDISKKLKCHHETARYHLLRMLEIGMISCTEGSNSKKSTRYYLTTSQKIQLAQLVLND